MKKEKKLLVLSMILYIAGIITSYVGLVDVSNSIELNLHQAPTFLNVFALMWQMLSHSVWFSIMLLCFVASAILRPSVFASSLMGSMLIFIGWLCAIHSKMEFLPRISEVYSSGWSHITISQHFTLTAGLIAVIIFGIGLVAHYRIFYRGYSWENYMYKTLMP